ncbi:Thioredoxin reductase [Reichenbachiella faecimaris]|uniref:Thioredoxin reductase n=1 Tax=Reichenbachiella faecimaris TaxID=692418 RepID=A0A1W2GE25_REIFA|nr:NAD(P)/FAD-dependent oxidoreductase [Reichenbachiella faecimaris]SMD34578.1 Thioredoxin reductase [Reichenbachiella faecimaris]
MDKSFEVIIIGGSYAGLSAALALGRSLRKVLVIDAGKPCNLPTPHAHNLLTQDGVAPDEISAIAKSQVEKYNTVQFYEGLAIGGNKIPGGFTITTADGIIFSAKKLIFATGLKDIMPDIEGFAECWGQSVVHCPYCHGYEIRQLKTGIVANGEKAHHYATLISNWTDELTVFTHGPSTLTADQTKQISKHAISIVETPIKRIQHVNGQVQAIVLEDDTKVELRAIYSGPEFVQHSRIPEELGCQLNEQGLIHVDGFQLTSVPGVYACGDNSTMRSLSLAVASGTKAGVVVNKDLIEEVF